jgi:hypothetical protein
MFDSITVLCIFVFYFYYKFKFFVRKYFKYIVLYILNIIYYIHYDKMLAHKGKSTRKLITHLKCQKKPYYPGFLFIL